MINATIKKGFTKGRPKFAKTGLPDQKKYRKYAALIAHSWPGDTTILCLMVSATGRREARALANEIIQRIPPADLGAMCIECSDLERDEVFHVYEVLSTSEHVFTREELDSFDSQTGPFPQVHSKSVQ